MGGHGRTLTVTEMMEYRGILPASVHAISHRLIKSEEMASDAEYVVFRSGLDWGQMGTIYSVPMRGLAFELDNKAFM